MSIEAKSAVNRCNLNTYACCWKFYLFDLPSHSPPKKERESGISSSGSNIFCGKSSVYHINTNPIKPTKIHHTKPWWMVDNTPHKYCTCFGMMVMVVFDRCWHIRHKNRVKPCVELWFNWIVQVKLIRECVWCSKKILLTWIWMCVCGPCACTFTVSNTFRL